MKRVFSLLWSCSMVLCINLVLASPSGAQDITPWQVLMQANYEEVSTPEGRRWVPQFPADVEQLNDKTVRISGFMIPLGYEEKQSHFLISAYPGHGCYFHLPGGPSAVMEVKATKGVEFSYDTISIQGRLSLLRDDPYGLFYRLTDAKPVQ